ncbi:double-strand break repair helicase AddA [Sphingosinicella ginsenosidimutans]|uniref:DNA 3'-5' helicase n=1 Tax=Allosphingosinicella ginsenosidimutans TaxID=1176539 RepID=A0A5C6TW70_9SPHN|nr:double-strand break repair helicase AddA [Sphingosinicella ginsenosidimutans]TXC64607.1 double-strand break repair helicase AddA [Sphingosinicella ginsenosidimutans]
MAHRPKPLARLDGDQLRASAPRDHAALSASAGTGKTHVLTARVLRLLLQRRPEVDPSAILCLTFTKAGAAEMAERIHQRLAYWVRLDDSRLRKELFALGEPNDDDAVARARTLFARVLESTGGGLRIQTIHAFAQSLLGAFPAEAGLAPGFRPLEGREEKQLARSALAELLVRAEGEGDHGLVRDVQALSLRLGEGGAEGFMRTCARAPEAMAALGPREGIEARLRHAFGLPIGDIEEAIAAACADDAFDLDSVRAIADANRAWGATSGLAACDAIAAWLAKDPAGRSAELETLALVVRRRSGEMRTWSAGLLKVAPDYPGLAERLGNACSRLLTMRAVASFVSALAAGLRAGQAFALAYDRAKRAAGAVDFDDLIRQAEKLLLKPDMGDWVRYKLDRQTDHILVDEAQDTNERQWNIVRALSLEFFAGEGARGRHRTIFTVGDYKQAIFGFQGTDPRSFETARAWFAREAGAIGRPFLDLSVDLSFRSSPAVLEVVDRVIGNLGHEALGLLRPPNPHASFFAGRPGSVTLWAPFTDERGEDEDPGEEGWVSDTVRRYAKAVARQVKAWIDRPFRIESEKRALRPEDILILVRRRSTLAALLVARLHAEGVPVAGVDRLLLSAPLAVQDLLAAARFAVQPFDDLNLANLLVSPLFGWSQEELHAVAAGRGRAPLWQALRSGGTVPDGLSAILAMADYATPHGFFETILSGPIDGRRKLMTRLGAEARDPIEELLSAALEFESSGTSSLQAFLDWFARDDVEIVRDPSRPLGAVRVMTAHGAKGLQSPVVILADACADPGRLGPNARLASVEMDGSSVPVFAPRKEEKAEPLVSRIAEQEARDRQEHWRLLYVALTRAEERLYVGGALTSRDRNGPPEASWYKAVEDALVGLGAAWTEEERWGRTLHHGDPETPSRPDLPVPSTRATPMPDWITRPAPLEARPPRPLAPSAIGEDDAPYPPPGPALKRAAERGKLLHSLFERLPGVPPAERRARAARWLEHAAGVTDADFRDELIADACRVVDDPRFVDLFGPQSLAEAPIAAVIGGGDVVAGTVDRLLVASDRILVADFKTGRRAPLSLDEIPSAHLRQMAAYRAALRVIFPDRAVEAALLYSAAPILHALPDSLLDAHAPAGA